MEGVAEETRGVATTIAAVTDDIADNVNGETVDVDISVVVCLEMCCG